MPETSPSLPPKDFFRKEAVAYQQEKFWGEVLITRPLPLALLTFIALAIAAAIGGYLWWGEYTRKVKVAGFLAPQVGIVRVAAPQTGVLTTLADEGAAVKAGERIATITLERDPGSAARQIALGSEIERRRDSLKDERARLSTTLGEALRQLSTRENSLKSELTALQSEMTAQSERLGALTGIAERHAQLNKEGFIGPNIAEQKRSDALEQRTKLEAMRRTQAQLERDLQTAQSERRTLALKTESAQGEIDRQLSALDKERVDTNDRQREVDVIAPIDGTIATRAVTRGQTLASGAPMVSLLPAQNELQAELMVPTRAAGFVRPGQAVALRYQAFPFERFGHAKGVVKEVGRNVLTPSEAAPLTVSEPVYRVVVTIPEQTVNAYGQPMALRAGMLLDADVLLEKRRLYEWVIEPILATLGRA